MLPALTASYRVIRYDARGFGRSPAPAVKFSLLADLITVLGYYGLDRAAMVGCSQGGGSALGLAIEQSARVTALVLLCPGVPGYRWPEEPGELDAEYEHALDTADGDADYPPLIQANRQAAARIPGCELTVVPGRDHLPPLREPDLVLSTIRSTLSRAGW